jgi:hypothetical protein
MKKRARVKQGTQKAVAVLASIFLAGCCCTNNKPVGGGYASACKDNVDAGLPIIRCQPLDVSVQPGTKASFYVEATGNNLTYQWHFLGNGATDYVPIPNATQPLLVKDPVGAADYGLYSCTIRSESDATGIKVTETREAGLGRRSGGSGGPFTPMQFPSASGGVSSICGQTVSGKWVLFPDTQIPPTGKTGFQGSIWNVTAEPDVQISNNDYVLQWWVTGANTGCCSKVIPPTPPNEVKCNVTAGLVYRFIAHFKVGKAPPNGTMIELRGLWTP